MEKIQILKNKNDINNSEMREVSVNGRHYLVARIADEFYVTEGRCPHLGGKLSQGKLEGTVITCPLHGSQFDLIDGRAIKWTEWTGLIQKIGKAFKTPRSLKVYKVSFDGESVYIEV